MEIVFRVLICIVGITLLLAAGGRFRKMIRRRKRRRHGDYWSIGYQRSTNPFVWEPAAAKVYGRDKVAPEVKSLADPFLIRVQGKVYLFCELEWKHRPRASIGVSVYNEQDDTWTFLGIALEESFHLSYPYVFSHDGEVYMAPESKQAKSVRLYRATAFPHSWKLEKILVADRKLVDPCVARWEGTWYLWASRKRRLYLYYADTLTGTWRPHPKSPIRRWNHARCAGRVLEYGGSLCRLAQEQAKGYGAAVHAYRIVELSKTAYREEPLQRRPILEPCGQGWANTAMHHLDAMPLDNGVYLGVFDGAGKLHEV